MALDEDLPERMRVALAGAGAIREVKMFGGLCFMLNGNMVAGTSKSGLFVRVGKEQRARALVRPDARPMEMSAVRWRVKPIIEPPPKENRALGEWLKLVGFVDTRR